MRRENAIIGIVIIFVLLLWSPWLTPSIVRSLVLKKINSFQNDKIGECNFYCRDCSIEYPESDWFGKVIDVNYSCGKDYDKVYRLHLYISPFLFISFLPEYLK